MSIEQIAAIIWRRRLAFVVAFVLAVAAVVAVTLSLPKSYSATATLYVGGQIPTDTFIDTSLLERHVRTYATLAGNPNMAALVVDELPGALTPSRLLDRMAFAPVERTQLLQITAEGGSAEEATQVANTYAETFVARMTEQFETGKAPAEIALAEPAREPGAPSKPNPPLYIGLGTILALALGLAVALARDRLDTRIRVEPQDDVLFGEPIVARIPPFQPQNARTREVGDRFGLLKTNLDFLGEVPPRVVVVTSAGVSEGKSTISANLALAYAADGDRVVLIEADLRRPGLSATVLGEPIERQRVGLSNYLAGVASEEEIVNRGVEHPDLSVVWSGLVPPNSTALLGSTRLDTLLASLRLEYDRIVVDTPPVSIGADASVVSSRADGAVFVIDERSTKRMEAIAGLNQLRGVRARILGVVLNKAALIGAESYYYGGDPTEPDQKRSRRRRTESFS